MKSLEFDPGAFDDLTWWVKEDRKKALRILSLIEDIRRSPFQGIGKPELLRGNLAGFWSRRIDDEHRIVYKVKEESIRIVSCRGHYG